MGTTIFITCFSDTPPTFSKEGNQRIHNVITHEDVNTLTLRNVREKMSGNYTCHGTEDNNPFQVSSLLLIAGILSSLLSIDFIIDY